MLCNTQRILQNWETMDYKTAVHQSCVCGSYGITWLCLRTDLKPLCCTNPSNHTHTLQSVCELIYIVSCFTLLNSSRPSTSPCVVCSVNTLGVTEVKRWTHSQRKYCWFTMTLQTPPLLLTLTPPL